MKHCEKCSLDFPASYRFCGSCGGSLNDSLRCQGCGALVESKWTFCTTCGRTLSPGETSGQSVLPDVLEPAHLSSASSAPSPASPTLQSRTASEAEPPSQRSIQEWYATPDLFDEDSETTATSVPHQALVPKPTIASPQLAAPAAGNGKAAPTLTMLSAYGQVEASRPAESQGRHGLGLLIGVVLLVFFGVLGFGGWYWWTHRALAAQSPPPAETTNIPSAADSSSSASSASKASSSSVATKAVDGADREWKQLREKRIGAKPSDASEVINSLAEAEKKYPNDYRFPYERAKLSIKGITSHHEAFSALLLAGDKAIDNGKTQEMLDSLMADKDGDFYKLSRGHHEWETLIQALKIKDRATLNALRN